eukprot:3043934-Rhodomonas_salina.1
MMRLHDLLDEAQTQSGSAVLARTRHVDLREGFPHLLPPARQPPSQSRTSRSASLNALLPGLGDATASVNHLDQHFLAVELPSPQRHAAVLRELDR